MKESMSPRERWLAAINLQPVDRLPFWPKIDVAYIPAQKEPFCKMNNPELHRWIGSDQHVGGPNCVKTVRKKTKIECREEKEVRTTLFHTQAGVLKSVEYFDSASCSWHPREFPVKDVRDIEAMCLVFSDVSYEFDSGQFEKASACIKNTGEEGITFTGMGVSPLMDWIQHIAGIENGILMLMDHREKVEALFEIMHKGLCGCAEIAANKSPHKIIYSTENTSTTLISPAMFKKYCYKHLNEYGRIVKSAGKFHILHMCGHLKKLLPDIDTLPADGIEAFTSPSVGNTTLLDGRTNCSKKCLIGGTNAVLWLKDADTIIKTIERDLNALPHHRGIVVTSGGVMPPGCNPEKIKKVGEWVKNYKK